ncbi:MAG TPA: hypothetical protein VN428_20250, partial [Bryobacteraceae bacterium]|nr:hypothetical protein [Bryobacteraceae bacterium]
MEIEVIFPNGVPDSLIGKTLTITDPRLKSKAGATPAEPQTSVSGSVQIEPNKPSATPDPEGDIRQFVPSGNEPTEPRRSESGSGQNEPTTADPDPAQPRRSEQSRDGNGAAAGHSTTDTTPGENEPNHPNSVPLATSSLLPPPAAASAPPKRSRAEAARENGAKSRGPITPEGKARSSQNALKHGLSARQVVLGTEEDDEWWDFREECRIALEPLGAVEISYADEFAASRWRLQRCLGIETTIFDYELAVQKRDLAEKYNTIDKVARTGMAFKSAKEDLNALGRYESRIRRAGERALTNLLKLKALRPNEPNAPNEPEPEEPDNRHEPLTPDGDMLRVSPPVDEPGPNEPNAPQ